MSPKALGKHVARSTSELSSLRSQVNSSPLKTMAKGGLNYIKANPGKAALIAAGTYGLGRLMGYGGRRVSQGIDNYVLTDVNSQDRR